MTMHKTLGAAVVSALPVVLVSGLVACDGEISGPETTFDISVAFSPEVPTVAIVTFTTSAGAVDSASIEYGLDESYGLVAPATADDAGRVILMGLKPLRDYHFRITAEVDGRSYTSDDQMLEVTTGPPTTLPDISVEVIDPDQAEIGFYLCSILMQDAYAVILDDDGDYVWWWRRENVNWDEQYIPRVYLSNDGESVVYLDESAFVVGDGAVTRVGFTGEDWDIVDVRDAHHDFVELPDGTVAVLRYETRTVDGEVVSGDQIVEFDADGNERVVFTTWDYFEYDPETVENEPGSSWTHSNALDYHPDDDAYLVSVRNFDTVWKIDRQSGEPLLKIGGEDSDYVGPGDTTDLFRRQHQFALDGEQFVVFSNNDPTEQNSQAYRYELDHDAGRADLVWVFEHDPPIFASAYGEADILPGGHTLVVYSVGGEANQLDDAGEVVWRAQVDLGGGLSYMHFVENLYR